MRQKNTSQPKTESDGAKDGAKDGCTRDRTGDLSQAHSPGDAKRKSYH